MDSESGKHFLLLCLQSFSKGKMLITWIWYLQIIWILLLSCLYFVKRQDVNINFIEKEISESENRFQPGRSVLGWEHAVLILPTQRCQRIWVMSINATSIYRFLRNRCSYTCCWVAIFFKEGLGWKCWAPHNWLNQYKVSRVIPLWEITEVVAKCNSCPLGKFQSFDNCFCPQNIQAIRNVHTYKTLKMKYYALEEYQCFEVQTSWNKMFDSYFPKGTFQNIKSKLNQIHILKLSRLNCCLVSFISSIMNKLVIDWKTRLPWTICIYYMWSEPYKLWITI